MARPKATPEQREEIRRGIQTAAAAIYRKQGIGGISARAVAKDASVSVGAIYAHFGDLTGLMQSLWTGHVDRQNEVFAAVANKHTEPLARIRALLEAYLKFGVDNSELYKNAFMFVRPESHETPEAAAPGSTAFGNLLLEAVRQGQASGDILSKDANTIVQLLWSGVHGCLALPINFDRLAFTPTGEVAKAMVEALVKAVRA